jgi:hypothetical protein
MAGAAVFTGSYTSHTAIGIREDLQNAIFDISPMDTPFISGCSRGKAKDVVHEWQTDVLADATTDNASIEGANHTTISTVAPTRKVANYLQISEKTVAVSGTLEAVDKAGRKNELAYQLARRGKELKRDMESIVLGQIATPDAGDATTARLMAGLPLWIVDNDSRGAGGADSAHATGIPTDTTFSDGTDRAITETLLKAVVKSLYDNGGDPNMLMVGSWVKQVASGAFDGIAAPTINVNSESAKPATSIAALDVYVSDFGKFSIVPNRFQRGRDAWLLDMEYCGLAFLRPMQTIKLAKTGDAEKRLLLVEYTLVVKNQKALGVIADLSTS